LERWIGSLSPFKNAGKQRQKAKVQKFWCPSMNAS
jgi:hypothetical protein